MKHYKNTDGKVFAFESDGSQDHLIKPDMALMTDAEVTEHIKPDTVAIRRNEILFRLAEIDKLSIRPLRAGETDRLAELETEADLLRAELSTLV